MGFLSSPLFNMHVLTRKLETSGGDYAAAVRRSASQLATRLGRIPFPSSLLGI